MISCQITFHQKSKTATKQQKCPMKVLTKRDSNLCDNIKLLSQKWLLVKADLDSLTPSPTQFEWNVFSERIASFPAHFPSHLVKETLKPIPPERISMFYHCLQSNAW